MLSAPPPGLAAGAVVQRFSPQGHVKAPQQVTAVFSTAMVPFGDLRDVSPPFEIACPAKGTSRWIDSQTWAFDFEKPLPAGMRCVFTLRRGLKANDGTAVTAAAPFRFDTGGPAIVSTTPPSGGGSIDEQQIFLVELDGEVDPDSVREKAGFVVDGLRERIEVDILSGTELEALVASLDRWSKPTPPYIGLRARRSFPNEKGVVLQWGRGIRSPGGLATLTPTSLPFTVRPAFSVDTACRRENAQYGCLPITPINIQFSSPVAVDKAAALRLVAPDGSEKEPSPLSDDTTAEGFTQRIEFRGPFAENATYTVRIPADLRDDAGRSLPAEQATSMKVKTGPPPVLAKFAARFGILERNAGPALPVTLRNVESQLGGVDVLPVAPAADTTLGRIYSTVTGTDLRVAGDDPKQILTWLRRVANATRARSLLDNANTDPAVGQRRELTLPKPAPAVESEVVGIPLDTPGLHIVELSSPLLGAALLGSERRMFVSAAALVTNMAVHFKRGRESSIAWVTTLDGARPVAGARVTVSDCAGTELATAETGADGVARFALIEEKEEDWSANCRLETVPDENDPANWNESYSTPALGSLAAGLLVVAKTADDMSFVHTSWDRGIESWRFDLPDGDWGAGAPALHTVFDRSLFRERETVHMKHVLRDKVLAGFAVPAEAGRPKLTIIEHVGSGTRYELATTFDDTGTATLDWPIPAGAKLGSYEVALQHGDSWTSSGSFRVEQFRVPLMRGEVTMAPVVAPRTTSLDVDISVRHLSGGPAAQLAVVLRSELRPGGFAAPDDYSAYTFAAGPVREGFDDDPYEDDAPGDDAPRPHHRDDLRLDAAGTTRATLRNLPVIDRPTDLVVELEFRDPNGEAQTVAAVRTLLPSSRVPGIRIDDWTDASETITPRIVVLGPDGKPVADAPVRVEVAQRESYSHRKRLVGGFYGYVHTSEVKKIGPLCEGRTDALGLFHCDARPPRRGSLLVEAIVADAAGGESRTHTEIWVSGEEEGFETHPSDRIDVLPEKKSYEPGETARFQVRMPFREATALVTIEREGIGEARVMDLRADNPVIDVPIRDEHAPNVYVSVMVVRGRVGDVQPTALVDLGRPAYKLGIAEVGVQVRSHRLAVAVSADREIYRIREKARVRVAVRTHDGKAPAPGSEVAIAAVDEGLLELAPNPSWELLDAMMGRRPYEVETATAQLEVVGKRHYGRKASPAGGGGGRSATRELFDTLLLWAPRVALDANGDADVEVPLNDSLTAFRIVAVATSETGRFGSGSTTIRSTRELSVLSGLPPLVREGDELTAEFTLHNTSDAILDVRVSGEVEGLAGGLPEQRVPLAPGEGRIVTWPLRVPSGRGELVYVMTATAAPPVEDRLRVRQRVVPAERVQVTQATLEQVDGSRSFPVRLPAGADPDAAGSGITVSAAASLADSVDSVKQWLARYPYTCLEQRVSMAIGREDDKAWQAIVAAIESYIDDSGLLRYFPGNEPGDDTLTAYVLAISLAAGRVLPDDVRDRMVGGLTGFVAGTVAPSRGPLVPDYTLRKLAALAALARAGKAEPSMIASITIQPALWPTSALLDWWNFLLAVEIGDRAARLEEVENVMRSRVDLSGTTLAFRGTQQGNLWWMMASVDSDAARLLLLLSEKALWKTDAPRVLRGVVARREGGAWQTTVANAWGVLAMRAFARSFENEKVTGRTAVELAGAKDAAIWTAAAPPPIVLPWPQQESSLTVVHEGAGKPWITTTARAAVPATAPVAAGYRVRKTVTPIEPIEPGKTRRGDRLHVRLDIDAQRDMWWVAIDDPIPAGASHLGSGLGRGDISESLPRGKDCSAGDGEDEGGCDEASSRDDSLQPAYVERSQESWRAYVRHVPAGHSRIEYAIRLNQSGTFHMPATRIEALYAPEMFGELPNAIVKVQP